MRSKFQLLKIGFVMALIGIKVSVLRWKLNKDCLVYPLTSNHLLRIKKKLHRLWENFDLNEEAYKTINNEAKADKYPKEI